MIYYPQYETNNFFFTHYCWVLVLWCDEAGICMSLVEPALYADADAFFYPDPDPVLPVDQSDDENRSACDRHIDAYGYADIVSYTHRHTHADGNAKRNYDA